MSEAAVEETIVVNENTVVEQPVNLELEVKEIKAQDEYLLDVIQKMAKHMNCEGLL